MNLKEYCNSLSKEKLSELALKLCDKAHPIWLNYSGDNSISYRDTVVGELHIIKRNLLIDTLALCRHLQTNSALLQKEQASLMDTFLEPITALQDEDWVLPSPVKKSFYAVYNLLRGFKQELNASGELFHYVSVNQAGDAIIEAGLMTIDEIKKIIYE